MTASEPGTIKRDAKGRILPGSASVNPGGRRAWSPEDHEALTALVPKAWKRLGELLASQDEAIAAKAVSIVLDRKFGRPPEEPDDSAKGGRIALLIAALEADTGD